MNIGLQAAYVALGAALGAWTRWQMSTWLNSSLHFCALGTLLVNWLGCFVAGCLLSISLSAPMKLWLITGFLGSFTTFSAFSSEIVSLITQERWWQAWGVWLLHSVGGIAMAMLGLCLMRFWCGK